MHNLRMEVVRQEARSPKAMSPTELPEDGEVYRNYYSIDDESATTVPFENNKIEVFKAPSSASPDQGKLNLGIERQIEIDGVGMGVLSDGTPFLTGRGLARLCGVTHAQIQRLSVEWIDAAPKPRVTAIKEILKKRGIELDSPYVAITQRSGTFFAYPDAVAAMPAKRRCPNRRFFYQPSFRICSTNSTEFLSPVAPACRIYKCLICAVLNQKE